MSQTNGSTPAGAQVTDAPQMPLFFTNVSGVNPAEVPDLRLDREHGHSFAAKTQTIPIGLGEFEAAARSYPILYTPGPNPVPVALVGLDARGNLFVGPDGKWRADTYIPAYVRCFPFVLIDDPATGSTFIGMETTAPCLGTTVGDRLFEDGKPTQLMNDAIGLCTTVRDNIASAAAMARALAAEGLLEDEEAHVTFTGGGDLHIRGFQLLRTDRLDGVSDATFLEWRRRGWLGPIFAQLYSSAQWSRLIDLASAERVAAAG